MLQLFCIITYVAIQGNYIIKWFKIVNNKSVQDRDSSWVYGIVPHDVIETFMNSPWSFHLDVVAIPWAMHL